MSEVTEDKIVMPPGVDDPRAARKKIVPGSCEKCGAKKGKFHPLFGRMEVCTKCGHERSTADA